MILEFRYEVRFCPKGKPTFRGDLISRVPLHIGETINVEDTIFTINEIIHDQGDTYPYVIAREHTI